MAAEGRAALVTGGSRGIGRAICLELARRGINVAVNYTQNREAAEEVVRAAHESGVNSFPVRADVTQETQVQDMIQACVDRFGRLDVLVSNAGVWRGGRTTTLSSEDWHLVLRTSLDGAFYTAKYALPHMQAAGQGRIVFISSAVGLIGWPGDAAYATAKAGLFGLCRSLAKEVAGQGITVNVVAPGSTETDMTFGLKEKSRSALLASIPLGRLGQPEETAEIVGLLACGADYVTGQVLVVDGGISL